MEKELYEKLRIIHWLIDGAGIHCLPMRMASGLTKERICELYNMELSYFEMPADFFRKRKLSLHQQTDRVKTRGGTQMRVNSL